MKPEVVALVKTQVDEFLNKFE
jgi:hypothetical protein